MLDLVQTSRISNSVVIVISNSVNRSKKMELFILPQSVCELNTTKETSHRHNFKRTNNIVYVSFDFSDFFVRFCQRF